MKLTTRSNTPIPISIGDKDYSLPPLKREDWIAFGAKLDDERAQKATAHLSDPNQKAKQLAYFPIAPLTYNELRQFVQSVAGIHAVVRASLAKVGVDEPTIAAILEGNMDDLQALAFMLAGLIPVGDEQGGPPPDFTSGQKGESAASPAMPPAT